MSKVLKHILKLYKQAQVDKKAGEKESFIDDYPIGTELKLKDGRECIVKGKTYGSGGVVTDEYITVIFPAEDDHEEDIAREDIEQVITFASKKTKLTKKAATIEQQINDKKYSIDTENYDANKLLEMVDEIVYDYDVISKALDMANNQKEDEFAVYTLSPDKSKIVNMKYIKKDDVYNYKPNQNEYALVGVRDTGFIDTDYQLQPMIMVVRSWNESRKFYSSKKKNVVKKAWTDAEKKQVGAIEENKDKYKIYQTMGGEIIVTNHKLNDKYALMDSANTIEEIEDKIATDWEDHANAVLWDSALKGEVWFMEEAEEGETGIVDMSSDYAEETKEAAKRDYTAQLNQVKDIMKEYGYGLTDNGFIYLLNKEEPKDEGFQVKFKGDRLRVELDGKLRYSGYGPQAIEDFLVGAFYAKKQSSKANAMRKRAFKKLALKRAMHKTAGEFEEMMKLKSTDPKLIKYLAKEFGVEESTVSQYTDVSENAEELYNILDEQANKYGYEWDKFEYDEYGDRIDENDFRGDTDDLEKAVEYLKNNIDKSMFKFEYVGEYEDNYLTFSVNEKLIPTEPTEKPIVYVTNDTKNYDISFFVQSQQSKERYEAKGIQSNDDSLTILIRRTSDEILNEIVNYVNVVLPKKVAEQNTKQSSKTNKLQKKATKTLEEVAGLIDTILDDFDHYGYSDTLEVDEFSGYERILADLQKDEKKVIEETLNYIAEDDSDEPFTSKELDELKAYYNSKFGKVAVKTAEKKQEKVFGKYKIVYYFNPNKFGGNIFIKNLKDGKYLASYYEDTFMYAAKEGNPIRAYTVPATQNDTPENTLSPEQVREIAEWIQSISKKSFKINKLQKKAGWKVLTPKDLTEEVKDEFLKDSIKEYAGHVKKEDFYFVKGIKEKEDDQFSYEWEEGMFGEWGKNVQGEVWYSLTDLGDDWDYIYLIKEDKLYKMPNREKLIDFGVVSTKTSATKKKAVLQVSENGMGYVLPNGQVVYPGDEAYVKSELKGDKELLEKTKAKIIRLEKAVEEIKKEYPNVDLSKYPDSALFKLDRELKLKETLELCIETEEDILNAFKENKLPRQTTKKQADNGQKKLINAWYYHKIGDKYVREKIADRQSVYLKYPENEEDRYTLIDDVKDKLKSYARWYFKPEKGSKLGDKIVITDYSTDKDLGEIEYNENYISAKKHKTLNKQATIKHENGVYNVYSESGKCLGKGYKTKEEAEKRLKQVEYFKNKKSSLRRKAFLIQVSKEMVKDAMDIWQSQLSLYDKKYNTDEEIGKAEIEQKDKEYNFYVKWDYQYGNFMNRHNDTFYKLYKNQISIDEAVERINALEKQMDEYNSKRASNKKSLKSIVISKMAEKKDIEQIIDLLEKKYEDTLFSAWDNGEGDLKDAINEILLSEKIEINDKQIDEIEDYFSVYFM